MRIFKYLMTAAAALAICGCSEKDETEKKIDDLLSRMTLHEKIGQMNQLSGGDWLTEAAEKGEVGSILNCVDPAEINRVQKAAVERSRLGIPILVSRDVIHGFKTIFPIPLGLAATFDPELVESGSRRGRFLRSEMDILADAGHLKGSALGQDRREFRRGSVP